MIALQIVFWICVTGVLTPYLIYPVLLFLFSRFGRGRNGKESTPSVTFVISAYNEADVIAQKIENTLAIEYPANLFQIVVISDESDDGTDEIVKRFEDVELFRQSPRRGKSAGINDSFNKFKGEFVVFSDANAMYQPDTIKHLVKHFIDPQVGYVVGRQLYYNDKTSASESENTYWGFELKLKEWESRLSSVVGGDGAIMAIRRSLYSPLAADDISDFVLPLRIVVAGYRGRFEPRAICYEEAAPSLGGEFRRKVRIVNRSLRAVFRVPHSLNPFKVGVFSFQLFCHKFIRWFAAYLMLGALISSGVLTLSGELAYLYLFAAQAVLYLIALLSVCPPLGRFRLTRLLYYFCLANLAGGVGVFKCLLGQKYSTWNPQRQLSESNSIRPRS